ncbi:MAG TPA: folylpolyglutamate synthase/dihydrofolate synthase family protein [Dehalococcoidales bacterium]|nr:folylpolyglutamate synthase/dihydrofolate synthase family protein [Dehalococcoidales bacterium]
MTESAINPALDYIYSFIDFERQGLKAPRNWDLRRVQALLSRLGDPHLKSKTIHIAGSKGKGSTAAMIASVLTASGYKTGLYTSPHLHEFNERIQIDRCCITDGEIVDMVNRVKPHVDAINTEDKFGRLTTFEIITAIGFQYFAENNVDFQVIEVGLGGRLDATNVVPRPEVSIITSISYEHTDVLGDTLTKIATEKAGIIKPGGTVVLSPQTAEPMAVFEKIAAERNARLIRVGKEVTYRDIGFDSVRQSLLVAGRLGEYRLSIPLLGHHQLDNAATAVAALEVLMELGYEIPAEKMMAGMSHVSWEARLQVLHRKPLVIVDGAHNVDSAHKLKESLKHYFQYRRAALIIGFSSDKDLAGIAAELAPAFTKVIATHSVHPRAMPTAPIAAEIRKYGIDVEETHDVSQAFRLALDWAAGDDLICVTGSLFVAAAAIEEAAKLGFKP